MKAVPTRHSVVHRQRAVDLARVGFVACLTVAAAACTNGSIESNGGAGGGSGQGGGGGSTSGSSGSGGVSINLSSAVTSSGGTTSAGGRTGADGAAGGTNGSGGATSAGGNQDAGPDMRTDVGAADGFGQDAVVDVDTSKKITVWMSGDSTMAGDTIDTTACAACPCGWGAQFSTVFNSNVSVTSLFRIKGF